jgi:hypothetical protein
MKKVIMSLLLMAAPVVLFAQLKVFSDGTVTIKGTTQNPYASLSVKNNDTSLSAYEIGVLCGSSPLNTTNYNVGLMANALFDNATSSGRSYGIIGTGGNATAGYNYGVFGRLAGSKYGAGVVGSVGSTIG